MQIEKIIKVKKIGLHIYEVRGQERGETAIYAKSNKRRGYRWYVAYGGDFLPAGKADIANIEVDLNPHKEDIEKYNGIYVRKYRDAS